MPDALFAMDIPSYISLPTGAIPIRPPEAGPSNHRNSQHVVRPEGARRHPSFPPSSSTVPPPAPRKFGIPSTSSITSNVSDMLLSSLLPPNLPKLPGGGGGGGGGKQGPGVPRELSTRKEALSLPLISNNFRRFVTKVGPVFWLQDRIEEVLFWRKPRWTWAWIMAWTFISFKPRLLLLVPSLLLILILLHIHERQHPLPSLLGVPLPPDGEIGTTRLPTSAPSNQAASVAVNSLTKVNAGATGYSATNASTESEPLPAVPPKEAESGVDYYMNVQAIQNLMGQISDIYDWTFPYVSRFSHPQSTSTQTSFPLTTTHLLIALLIPSLGLPLLPPYMIPYLLLPLGLAPPLFFHPNLTFFFLSLPRHPLILRAKAYLEDVVLTDALDDEIGRMPISRVEVWENERLDPVMVAKPPASGIVPSTSWSSRHLRAGERAPWVKVKSEDSVWLDQEPKLASQVSTDSDASSSGGEGQEKEEQMVLALKPGWIFIPGEEWKVDVCGLWSEVGSDENGWMYSDDSWQNPACRSLTEGDTAPSDKSSMPGLALRRVTRRRRWWRRVYLDVPEASPRDP
ncbi:hypothetical protein BD324DRAFT_636086 [Kockovaella imperatae]|uniref:TECPR1-like DysF domain-containing protein n=1 Tax=Kockovaella imperatae TaxID=4999 RepID=A0A1Y1U8Z0_9TREE|nr:hypothetical protein BD324DRAFT_636086 [Kockovaella imperatae]ORX34478.1 hypothetical protein BD324DRAFT_636086 [Kockovaella imperatae]